MSINGQFRQISPRALDLVLQQPELAGAALDWASEDEDPADPLAGLPAGTRAILEFLPEEARAKAAAEVRARAAMFPGLDALDARERAVLEAAGVRSADLPPALDIRKSWEPLNFLLAGTPHEPGPDPLGTAVLGGREVGEDLGYGPVRVLSPAETAEVADALEALGDGGLMARYSADAFEEAGLEPAGWDDPEEDEERREWMLDTYHEVRDYYVEARGRGYGMLLALV